MIAQMRTAILGMMLLGCEPPPPHHPEDYDSRPFKIDQGCYQPRSSYRDTKEAGYTLMLGIGFEEFEAKIFEVAAKRWVEKTGLPIEVSRGHGMKGNVHMFDELDVCSEGYEYTQWHEDRLGCYRADVDRIAYSRPGIMEFTERLIHDAGDDALTPEKQYNPGFVFCLFARDRPLAGRQRR